MTPRVPRDKAERIVGLYIANRGPERAWNRVAPACGFSAGSNGGKSLYSFLEKWAPFYGLSVPPRLYEKMTNMERHRVEMAFDGVKHSSPLAGSVGTAAEQTNTGDSSPVLDAYAEDGAAMDKGIEKPVKPIAPYGYASGAELPVYYSRPDNSFRFGATGDTHIGSKYHREDVINDLYRRFREAELDCVFNTGNWIDGYHPRVNHFDLVDGASTMEGQLRLLVRDYPVFDGPECVEITVKREGTEKRVRARGTFAVTGDDHEGWWARSDGFPIGDRAQTQMENEGGRHDWHDLGYMEAHVRLVNINTGASSILSVVHPGGGTAYAISYHPQKRIEALEGGEKPAVDLSGHLHKLFFFNLRNVWCIGTGCAQDITPFIRNRVRQEVHVGGQLVDLEQDPETGAIVGCGVKTLRYFVRGYYNNRWNKSGPVTLPARSL